MAGDGGFEPPHTDPESAVLPLDESPASRLVYQSRPRRENPPRAARLYALIAAAYFDDYIASQDSKFTYWYIRPSQLDPTIQPLFPTPNFPSYPSNHSTYSAARSEVLAYLFPAHADEVRAMAREAGDSRIWAGIHYQIDLDAGNQLGKAVAQKFIAWANEDGSQ